MEPLTLGLLSAGIGAAASGIASLLKAYLSSRKSSDVEVIGPTGEKTKLSLADAQSADSTVIKIALLREMLLNRKYKFGREFETLKSAIGSSDEETRMLLLLLGARHNTIPGGKDTWTLHAEGESIPKT
jgi:hypothetical protein